jgi:hypothetical protein
MSGNATNILSIFFFRDASGLELESKLKVKEVSRNVTNVPFCFFF